MFQPTRRIFLLMFCWIIMGSHYPSYAQGNPTSTGTFLTLYTEQYQNDERIMELCIRHAYTDGRGNYYLRDDDDGTVPFDNASEWRKLKIVNRNDLDYPPN